MYVEQIEISGFHASHSGESMDGAVVLVGKNHRMQISLTLPHRAELGKRKQRLLALAKALKAARRLPEYRRDGSLSFAPGLLPQTLRRA